MSRHWRFLGPTWRLVVAATTVVAAIDIPARLVLDPETLTRMGRLDWLYTLVFAADFIVGLVRSRRSRTEARRVSWEEAPGYPWHWFVTDLAAAIPFAALSAPPLLQLLRLLKLARIAEQMSRRQRAELHNPTIVRLVWFFFWVSLGLHWLACGWLALRGISPGLDGSADYIQALYWAAITLATVGYGDIVPHTDAERIFAMAAALLGVGVFGYIIGSVASLLANIDPARVRHRETVERMTAFMRYRQIPPRLQQRILDYYEYLWEKRLGYDESTAIAGLPPTLRTEVSLFLNRDIIQKVPLFRAASEDFVRDIALEMRPVVFLPGDYVIRAGDDGDEMYFISQGAVEVVSGDERIVYATLTSGQFFGEMALVLNQPRTASVRTVGYCDLYALDRPAFERILGRYPEIAAQIAATARERQQENRVAKVRDRSIEEEVETELVSARSP